MKILGISGLANAVSFKRTAWPGLEERLYRITQGHDAAAALLVDGELVAAVAEERFNRKKHSGDFPSGAIEYCLTQAGIRAGELDLVVHAFDYSPYQVVFTRSEDGAREFREVFSREALLAQIAEHFPEVPAEKVIALEHHRAHAASTYLTSGWDECLVGVVDAMGEAQGASFYHATGGAMRPLCRIPSRDSIGILYSLVTLHLGFDFNSDEYKIMGLAPYGDPTRHADFFASAVQLRDNGTIHIPMLRLNETRQDQANFAASSRYLAQELGPPRAPQEPVLDEHRDLAAALQACLDRTMLHLCGSWAEKTGQKRLAMAGGVALNCTANGELYRSGRFEEIYIQPAAGDDGVALGAALFQAQEVGEAKNVRSPVPLFGPAYSTSEVEAALDDLSGQIRVEKPEGYDSLCTEVARWIADGRVVAWFRGRMEFGPRALGSRSILADPGNPEMRDRVNALVKKRESFRPFAPAVSKEQAARWFDVAAGTELPYMTMIVKVREEHRARLPAITHVDGTARVQTVSAEDNEDFHQLLQHVGQTTGREMVLNTSFNVMGQPIVNTPRQAVETFLQTQIDRLVIQDLLIERR